MALYVCGAGTCTPEEIEDLKSLTKKSIPGRTGRIAGRLARIFSIAARKAVADAGLSSLEGVPMISATGSSEIDEGIKLLTQIEESGGETISPMLVQNSVTNAPASILSLALGCTGGAITISHGYLSPECGLAQADILLSTSSAGHLLYVAGEQHRPEWEDLLRTHGYPKAAEAIAACGFKESAVALVLSKTDRGKYNTQAGGYCLSQYGSSDPVLPPRLQRFLNDPGTIVINPFFSSPVCETIRNLLPDERTEILEKGSLNFSINKLMEYLNADTQEPLLLISSEGKDTGVLSLERIRPLNAKESQP